ncbi:hypothetical protein ABZ342_32775 [Amycolatopsis sp. NPDC005961]|uniref:hypothetical protein n=1 Tax=Amycolatopsis sp. NPDC005961 TaxID=3156720 RepID=UPI0033D9C80F
MSNKTPATTRLETPIATKRKASTLAQLRALATKVPESLIDTLGTTEAQARLLHRLASSHSGWMETVSEQFPSVGVELRRDTPFQGEISWRDGHWHIHVDSSLPPHVQEFAVIHGLKHIIDHPLQLKATTLKNEDWEAMADHFALACVSGDAKLKSSTR